MATPFDGQGGAAGAAAEDANFGSARSDYGELAYGGRLDAQGLERAGGGLSAVAEAVTGTGPKVLKPLPHAVIDYAMAGMLRTAPWALGFSRNRTATANAVASGAAVLGLSLLTRYPLGAAKVIPFPVHGVIEAAAGVMTAAAPWLMGFSRNNRAKWTHVASGLATLAVVAVTDYKAAEQAGDGGGGDGGGD